MPALFIHLLLHFISEHLYCFFFRYSNDHVNPYFCNLNIRFQSYQFVTLLSLLVITTVSTVSQQRISPSVGCILTTSKSAFYPNLYSRLLFILSSRILFIKYDKQDQQRKAAFNERKFKVCPHKKLFIYFTLYRTTNSNYIFMIFF
jgi:hypothetical protein